MTDDRQVVDPAALDRLLEMTGGDPEFLRELITTYLEDGAAQLVAMGEAAAAGDAEALVRPAHSLKSNSASMGADHLRDALPRPRGGCAGGSSGWCRRACR